ncbi:hypothetical protein OH77DRAFT_950707 [Trametes cingulata]|nr:hypothetical protein OH77DRAFT_950707 [Trametes cingulata]
MASNSTAPTMSPQGAASTADTQRMNLGSILIGGFIQAIFYGNLFSLTWRYYTRDRRADPWWFNAAVGLAWLLCTLSVAITIQGLWFFIFQSFTTSRALAPWTIDFYLFVNSMIATVVRLLYIYRLAKLCRTLTYFRRRALSTVVLLFTAVLCMVELAGSIDISVRLLRSQAATRGDVGSHLKPVFYLIFATGLSADIILTILMCFWLYSARTGIQRTDSVINTMIVYSIQTGLFPSIVETGGMIAFIVAPQSQTFLAFYIQIGVLYLSSLLTSLNTRRLVQQRIQRPITVNFSALNDDFGSETTDRGSRSTGPQQPVVQESRHLRMPEGALEEKALTPDVERPQEHLEREMLAHTLATDTDARAAWINSLPASPVPLRPYPSRERS